MARRPSSPAGLLALALAIALSLSAASAQSYTGASPKDTIDCDVAVVGAGPAGVYTAYRILETNSSVNVCLYEATHRVGGRVYSVRNLGPNRDLVLDMGAYRYMPLTQPIITDLIEKNLMLPNRLYQPGVQDYKIILTPDGSNAGFSAFVEALLAKAIDMGLQLKFNSEITKLSQNPGGGFTLTSKDGGNTTAEKVLLNLPSRPLNRLMQNSFLPDAEPVNTQLLNFYQIRATKLYLFYPNAWWVRAGMINGSLSLNPFWNQTAPNVPVVGRYHDGHVKCPTTGGSGTVAASSVGSPKYVDYYYATAAANGLDVNNCYGFVQITYTNDGGTTNTSHYALDYLVDYANPTPSVQDGYALPYTVWDNSTAMGAKLLKDAHDQTVQFHRNTNKTLPADVPTSYPTEAVVAFWDSSIIWSGGAWHNSKVANASEGEMVEQGIKPFEDLDLYVANEAYSTQLGWAEGGLVMAENIVQDYFGATKPAWMSDATYAASKFGPTFTDVESAAQGTGTGIAKAPAPSPMMMATTG